MLTFRFFGTRAVFLMTALVAQHAQPSSSASPHPRPTILEDYIYGFSPVTMAATRAAVTAVPDNTTFPLRAPINQFGYQTTLQAGLVGENADTLYTWAWLDLACEPMILHVPDTAGRYYLMPMLDAYSNEFASIGARTTGTGAGNYAIVGPNWKGRVPDSVSGVVIAPTNTVWIFGRTLLRGQADLPDAVALTKQYLLIPLSAYADFLKTGTYTPPTGVPVTPPNPDFVGPSITSSPGFSKPEFFDVLAAYVLQNPPPLDQLARATQFVVNGFVHQNELTPDIVKQANEEFASEFMPTRTNENGWLSVLNGGNYGTDYLLRSALTEFGLGTNIPADAVYRGAGSDIEGNRLVGTNSYVIHFAPGQTPPQRGFWSITVYGQDGFLVANPIQRYAVGSETGLTSNADGSIDISLQNIQPTTLGTNWLPTPTGPFQLTLRIYWPDELVLNGVWMPPPIARTAAPLP